LIGIVANKSATSGPAGTTDTVMDTDMVMATVMATVLE
jgi:hypothetical protein